MIHDFIHTALHVLLWLAGISFGAGTLFGLGLGALYRKVRRR